MSVVILRGDAASLPLPDASVDLIVTSPPFWQLRSYTDDGERYDGQIGSEATPAGYIASLLDCTREWARVLKPEGSLFVELGDKYADGRTDGFREKCLLDLPARYSIGCVDKLGLVKRANIVWHHVNGLPESATDRVPAAHSMVFHFTRQPRYFSAVDEIRLPGTGRGRATWEQRKAGGEPMRQGEQRITFPNGMAPNPLGKPPASVWAIPSAPLVIPPAVAHARCCGGLVPGCERGLAHHAAYPPELCRRVILGWSPPGVCTECGEGRRPVSAEVARNLAGGQRNKRGGGNHIGATRVRQGEGATTLRTAATRAITGYACACPQPDAPTHPAVVVDPFGGTGTTMLTASALGRIGVGVDRSADYCRIAQWRTADPAERARALGVPKPPPVPEGQGSLFDDREVS